MKVDIKPFQISPDAASNFPPGPKPIQHSKIVRTLQPLQKIAKALALSPIKGDVDLLTQALPAIKNRPVDRNATGDQVSSKPSTGRKFPFVW